MLVKNLSANMLAGLVGPALAIICTPFYISKLGVEGYGAVGLFAVAAVIVQVFAQSINITLERKAASRSEDEKGHREVASLFVALNRIYLYVVGIGIVLVCVFSPALAEFWRERSPSFTNDALPGVILGGAVVGVSVLNGLYASLFIGLAQQVFLSAVNIACACAHAGLACFFLLIRPLPSSFIIMQVITGVIGMFILLRRAHQILELGKNEVKPNFQIVKKHLSYSLSLMGVEGMGVLIAYLDKILIVALLPLNSLGVYNVAQTGARALGFLKGPLLQAFTPVILKWGNKEDSLDVSQRFWDIQTLLILVVGIPAAVIVAATYPLLTIWLSNPEVASSAASPLRWLIVGSFFMVISGPPYLAAVARKRTRPFLVFNIISIFLMIAFGPLLVKKWGMHGAALVWFGYTVAGMLFSFSQFAILYYQEKKILFLQDGFKSVVRLGVIASVMYYCLNNEALQRLMNSPSTTVWSITLIGIIGFISVIAGYFLCYGGTHPAKIIRKLNS